MLQIFYLSGAIGSAISGAIWTNEVPKRLALSISNSTLASSAFANPIGFIVKYGPGTPERAALSIAQTEAQVR